MPMMHKHGYVQAVAELPAAERVVLGFMRFIVSNPNARKMALVYVSLVIVDCQLLGIWCFGAGRT